MLCIFSRYFFNTLSDLNVSMQGKMFDVFDQVRLKLFRSKRKKNSYKTKVVKGNSFIFF